MTTYRESARASERTKSGPSNWRRNAGGDALKVVDAVAVVGDGIAS